MVGKRTRLGSSLRELSGAVLSQSEDELYGGLSFMFVCFARSAPTILQLHSLPGFPRPSGTSTGVPLLPQAWHTVAGICDSELFEAARSS